MESPVVGQKACVKAMNMGSEHQTILDGNRPDIKRSKQVFEIGARHVSSPPFNSYISTAIELASPHKACLLLKLQSF